MTHPLVSAFHRMRPLEVKAERDELPSSTFALQSLNELDVHISEVMASIPQVKFLVGFLQGCNNRVYLIWLWPLRAAWNVPDQYWSYWVFDAEWSYHDGYERHNFSTHCSQPSL